MRIAQVIPGLGVGGAERIVCSLSDHLANQGHEVKIFCLKDKIIMRPRNPAISLKGYGFSKYRPFSLISGLLRLKRDLVAFSPDIVHTHLLSGNIFGRLTNLSRRGPRYPLISTIHNNHAPTSINSLLYRLTDRLSAQTVAVSTEAGAVFVKAHACPPEKCSIIANGIAVDATRRSLDPTVRRQMRAVLDVTDADFLFLAIGRAVWEKDYHCMIKAFHLAQRQNMRLKLVIVGDGPELNHLRQTCQSLNLTERIAFMGEQVDARRFLPAADAFISTSRIEGFGLAIGEAMAEGLPTIAPRTGGVPELVGNAGWLCDPGNIEGFAKLILDISNLDRINLLCIGAQARARIKDGFSESAMHQAWESHLSYLAAKTMPPPVAT